MVFVPISTACAFVNSISLPVDSSRVGDRVYVLFPEFDIKYQMVNAIRQNPTMHPMAMPAIAPSDRAASSEDSEATPVGAIDGAGVGVLEGFNATGVSIEEATAACSIGSPIEAAAAARVLVKFPLLTAASREEDTALKAVVGSLKPASSAKKDTEYATDMPESCRVQVL